MNVENGEIVMNRYQPRKHKRPLKAIREKCVECMGGRESEGYVKRISECVSDDCPIYDFRQGKNPHHRQNLTVEQRTERGERLKTTLINDERSKKTSESVFNPGLHTKP